VHFSTGKVTEMGERSASQVARDFELYTGPSFNTEGAFAMMIYEGEPSPFPFSPPNTLNLKP